MRIHTHTHTPAYLHIYACAYAHAFVFFILFYKVPRASCFLRVLPEPKGVAAGHGMEKDGEATRNYCICDKCRFQSLVNNLHVSSFCSYAQTKFVVCVCVCVCLTVCVWSFASASLGARSEGVVFLVGQGSWRLQPGSNAGKKTSGDGDTVRASLASLSGLLALDSRLFISMAHVGVCVHAHILLFTRFWWESLLIL